jgi:hypothetical protein
MAVEDGIIRKNPVTGTLGDYGAAAAIPPDMPCGNAHEVRHNTRRRQPFCAQLRHMV